MLKNYFRSTWRNFLRHKGFTAINVLSLSVGFAACIIIFLFITDELSFDQQHNQKDSLYRLCEVQSFPGTNTQKVALSMPGMGPTLLTDFPEIVNYTRYWTRGRNLWEVGDQKVMVDMAVAVDSTFLEIFDFPLISGDKATVLDQPGSIVISRQVAMNFFNSLDVIGKSMKQGGRTLKVTGVMENVSYSSHLQFDILASMSTHVSKENTGFNTEFGSNYLNTYLKIGDQADLVELEKKFPDYLKRHTDNPDIADFYKLFIQPLSEVHLASIDIEHDYNNYRKFNGTYINVFVLVGIFILVIAAVNFTNLSSARAVTRSREVGVRKCIGASKSQLFKQFIFESVLLSFSALVVALLLDFVALPFLNDLISREFSLLTILSQPSLLFIGMGVVLLLGFLSGLYPSLFMASFKPVVILKGADKVGGKSYFRSSLIVLQFSLALAMIVATLVVVQQLFHMKNTNLGFDKDHILLVTMNNESNDKFDVIKQDLLTQSSVVGVTASGQRLGNNFHQWGFKAKLDTGMLDITPSNVLVDYDYLDVYDIKLIKGRTFSKDYATDDGLAFIINESFAKELGYDDPIGEKVGHSWYPNDSLGTVIGVTEDFNFNSLHFKVNTLSMVVHSGWGYEELSVKLNGNNIQQGIKEAEEVWNKHIRDRPFEYKFLDSHFDELYKSDEQLSSVITIIAILSIIIGCMGLFGLAAISMERRVKEIGIRKVLGATINQLIFLLSRDFALLIVISFMIAAPLTYIYLESWLDNFAYRVEIDILVFVISIVSALVIAMLTISHHVLKTAKANPVEALKYE